MTNPSNKSSRAVIFFIASLVVFMAVLPLNAGKDLSLFYIINWLSHGTTLGNLFSAAIYLAAAIVVIRNKKFSNRFDFTRGAATLYMLTTLLVYPLFLMSRPFFHNGFLEWRDLVLHWADPFFMICWWLLFPPSKPISASRSFLWLIPGAVYLICVFARGALINWYPYYLFYPSADGNWTNVIKIILIAAISFVLIAQLVAWMSRLQLRRAGNF